MFALAPILRRTGSLGRPERDFIDRFFGNFSLPSIAFEDTEWVPAFDVSETDKELIVKAEVPGIDKKDINITVSDGMLTIEGEKKHEKKEEDEPAVEDTDLDLPSQTNDTETDESDETEVSEIEELEV